MSYLQKISSDDPDAQETYKSIVLGLQALVKGVSYHESFKYFSLVEKLVNTYEKVENGVVALSEKLKAEGIVYAEIRTGLKNLGPGGYEEYVRAVLRGINRGAPGIKLKLILSVRRNSGAQIAQQTVDLAIKYKSAGVVALDVSGESTVGEIGEIIPAIMQAKQAGLYLALHLGESPEEIDTLEKQIAQAAVLEHLKPDRIGHGVFLSTQALAWVLNHPTVPIEVCPTSSVIASMVSHHSEHPGVSYYLKHKHPIVVGTDDPLLFQTDLVSEYRKLMEIEGIKIEHIMQMVDWSFDFCFLPSEEKLALRQGVAVSLLKSTKLLKPKSRI